MDREANQPLEMETSNYFADIEDKDNFIMPSEDDIEKSFRVNQDGSMTVEMKVRLTIKQEEMIHWTTTLSRTCANSQQKAVCSQPCSSDNNYPVRDLKRDSYQSKYDIPSAKSVKLNKEREDHCGSTSSEALEKPKPAFRRLPTPGPRHVRRKEASVENIKSISQNEVQESTVGAYSYMECTADGELTEGYCVVSRSSSSSTRPVPKPRKSSLGEAKPKKTHSSFKSSRVAEVLQLQNNGTEITETVMHVYDSQGTYENYFSNTQVIDDKRFEFRTKTKEPWKPDSTDSGPRSSSNDCDVDLTRQSTSSGSQNAGKTKLLSLSSGQSSPTQQTGNNLSCGTNNRKQAGPESSCQVLEDLEACAKENSDDKTIHRKKTIKPQKSQRSKEGTSSDTTVSDRRQKGRVSSSLKDLRNSISPETQSHTGSEKKTISSVESETHGQKPKKKKKDKRDGFQKSQSSIVNYGDQKESSDIHLNLDNATTAKSHKKINTHDGDSFRDSCQNVNIGQTDTPRAPIKKKLLDVVPPTNLKMLAKQRSMNECKIKPPKESRELSESVSMPVLHTPPSNVHQYVESWLKKIQPESVPYINEMDTHETEARAEFWIGSGSIDSSEIRSKPEEDAIEKEHTSVEDTTTESPVSHPPVQIRCDGLELSVETQRIRGFCKSMPSVRIHPAEHENRMRLNKSSEALAPIQPQAEEEASQSTNMTTSSGVKPVLQQLCLSIQSIRRTSSHPELPSLEKKSSSLPDFSSQVASVFGSPSKALLSFLSVMTLRDGISNTSNEDPVGNSDSYSEALQVMQSLEKIASIEDEEELKASLTSLQSSTSSQLKKSWKDFQERNDIEEDPPLSPRQSEQEFALEVNSEGEEQDKEHCLGIKELMDELNMSEDLRREISSLVDGEQTNSNQERPTRIDSGHSSKTTDIASENENLIMKDDFLEEEGGYTKEREIQDDKRMEPCALEPAPQSKDLIENVQTTEDETSQTDLVKHVRDMGDTAQTIQETNTGKNNKERDEEQERVACTQFKSERGEAELHPHTTELNTTDFSDQDSKLNDYQDRETENGDNVNVDLNEHKKAEKETGAHLQDKHGTFDDKEQYELDENQEAEHQNNVVIQKEDIGEDAKSQHQSQPGVANSEYESQNSHDRQEKLALESHDHDISIREETDNTKELDDAMPGTMESFADVANPDANDNGPMEEQDDKESEDALESEVPDEELHHLSMSLQEDAQSDRNKTGSSQKSESVHEHHHHSAEEIDEEKPEEHEDKLSNTFDSDKDFDSEPETKDPTVSDQDDKNSYQKKSESCNSQESKGEHEHQILQVKRVSKKQMGFPGKKDKEAEEHEDKHSTVTDSERDFDAEPDYAEMSDHSCELSDQDNRQPCKSQESELKHDSDTLEEENVTEEKEGEDEYEDKQSNILDSDEDTDAELKYPAVSDKDGEHSDQDNSLSCKSLESKVEHEHQTPEIESFAEEKEGEEDENEDKQSNVLDTDEDFDAEPDYPAVSDEGGDNSDQDNTQYCKTQESEPGHKLQTLDQESIPEGKDEESEENEDKQSSALDSEMDFDTEPEPNYKDSEQSDENKSESCKSQESEGEHEFQVLEEGSIIEKRFSSPGEKDEEAEEHVDKQSTDTDSERDFDAEPNYPAVLDKDDEHSDKNKTWSCRVQESESEHELQIPEDKSITEKKVELDEYENKQSNALDFDEDFNAEPDIPAVSDQDNDIQSCTCQSEAEHEPQTKQQENINEKQISSAKETPHPDTKHTKWRESCSSQDTEPHIAQSDTEGMDADQGCLCVQPMEISQELLDFVNLALLSSALTFTYDSNGYLRIKPDQCKIREMPLAGSSVDTQYVQRCLPSPNTSDLSDYRPETSASSGGLSQGSTDLFTETGEEELDRLTICQCSVKQSFKNLERHDEVLENGSVQTKSGTQHIASPSLKSVNSCASLHESMVKGTQEPAYSDTSSSSELVQRIVFHSDVERSEGILIDKGRWLLKENHLIRRSPPVPVGMYDNVDTTSADTPPDNTSEDAPFPPCVSQHSPLAAISSSELEELAKPLTPKCTYFNMPHSSDSDPFQDNQSINSRKSGSDIRKSRELKVCPMGEPSKTWARKNGSLPSFASVEFKLPDGKVHPEGGLGSGAVEKTVRSQSTRAAQEDESVEGLNLRCGRHCPIL